MIKEFKKFISRGNVIDLAVGVMIGAAFGKIITSIVDDILMPLIGGIIGGFSFVELSFTMGEVVIRYGSFIQNVVNFLAIALCLFLIIKLVNKFKPAKEEKPAAKPEDIVLLQEIRDLLKKQK